MSFTGNHKFNIYSLKSKQKPTKTSHNSVSEMQVNLTFCLCLEPGGIVSKDFLQKITAHVTTASSCDEPAPARNFRTQGRSSDPMTFNSKWNY